MPIPDNLNLVTRRPIDVHCHDVPDAKIVRVEALKAALTFLDLDAEPEIGTDRVVEVAKRFERYISGDTRVR